MGSIVDNPLFHANIFEFNCYQQNFSKNSTLGYRRTNPNYD